VLTLFALASTQGILDPGVRRALRLFALGGGAVFTGNAISTGYVLTLHDSPPVSWADLFYLSDSLLTLTALLCFPLARRTRMERWKFLLDGAMVLVGGAVAIWYFSVRPTAASQHGSLVVNLLAFAYPLASMLVLLGVTTVLLRRPIDGNRKAFGLLVTGVALGVVADLTFNLVQLEVGNRSASWARSSSAPVTSTNHSNSVPGASPEGAGPPRTSNVRPPPFVRTVHETAVADARAASTDARSLSRSSATTPSPSRAS